MAKSRSQKLANAKRGSVTPRKRRKAPAKSMTHAFVWRHLKLRVTHTPDYISAGWSHLELRVLAPKGAPCPVTTTGYLSHFLDAELLAARGGPVPFFTAWLDSEARTKAWAKIEAKWRQLDLFG